MTNYEINRLLRLISLPVSSGLSCVIVFEALLLLRGNWNFGFAVWYFGWIATIVGTIVGLPIILLIVDRKFSGYRFRYIIAGGICALVCLLLFVAFVPGAKNTTWASSISWIAVAVFLVIGLLAGVIYTGFVAAINRRFSQDPLAFYYTEFQSQLGATDASLGKSFKTFSATHSHKEVFLWLKKSLIEGKLPATAEPLLADFHVAARIDRDTPANPDTIKQ